MLEESWQPIADTLGFRSEEDMLRHLYYTQEFSLMQLRDILGYSTWAIRRRMAVYNIPLRGRGGPNNRAGKRRLKHIEDSELFEAPINRLAIKYDVHPSTIYAEKRFRKKVNKDELLSNNADIDVPSIREALEVSYGSGSVSDKQEVSGVLPEEGGGGRDGDSG